MKKTLFPIGALFCLLITSCAPTTNLYSWYDYENATYQYSKKHTDQLQEMVQKQYQKMDNQKGLRKTVPPGLYAERGFMLVNQGKKEEGIEYLKKEIALYPESSVFISKIIKMVEK